MSSDCGGCLVRTRLDWIPNRSHHHFVRHIIFMKTVKIAALHSLTWEGYGGHHWMGTIHHPDGNHELIRKVSRKEAKALSHDEESHYWPKTTERFETEEDLEKAALKWC